jgi:hypothetical protein
LKFKSALFTRLRFSRPLEVISNAWWNLPDIVVGLPYSLRRKSGARYPGKANGRTTSTPPTVIEVGYWNDQGTRHIPPRPFLTGARSDIQRQTLSLRKALLHQILLQGQQVDIKQTCDKVGALAAAVVQRRITNWSDPPNAPATIKAKKGVNNPLIDTGLLRKSITWELRKKEV